MLRPDQGIDIVAHTAKGPQIKAQVRRRPDKVPVDGVRFQKELSRNCFSARYISPDSSSKPILSFTARLSSCLPLRFARYSEWRYGEAAMVAQMRTLPRFAACARPPIVQAVKLNGLNRAGFAVVALIKKRTYLNGSRA
jgi:hypothetical protein